MNLGLLVAGRVVFDRNGRLVVLDDGAMAQSPLLPGAAFVQNPAAAGGSDYFTDWLYGIGSSVTPERLANHGDISPLEPFVNPYENIHLEGPGNSLNLLLIDHAITAQKAVRPKGTSWGAAAAGGVAAGSPPWEVMPPNGRPFHYQQAVSCPALGTNDFAVISFVVPTGWNAAIKAIANLYTSAGFVEGSNDLIWRIDVDGVYLPGFDSITTTLGSTDQSRRLEGAILAKSNELVRYTVSVAAAASIPVGVGNNVICAIDGWFYPES